MEVKKIRTGVKALIIHQDKVLIVKERINRPNVVKIIYDFPGGGIDLGEDLIKALKREVFEETGLKIDVGEVVGAWDFIVPKFSAPSDTKEAVQIVCIGYQCTIIADAGNKKITAKTPISEIKFDTDSNPAAVEDIFDITWMTKKEILKNGEKIFRPPAMLKAVKDLNF